jgi:CCR4-NOT transcription complex subunit 10
MRREPEQAFRFLHSVIPVMSDSPYLWLRLAECCVSFYKQRVERLRREHQISPVVARRLCTATRTFLVLPQTDYKLFEKYTAHGDDLNLQFGEKATRNAIALAQTDELIQVRKSAELLCAFIALELGDGRKAAEMGKAVFSCTTVDSQRQFLAKIYAAQGHSVMGDSSESARIMSRLLIESSKDLKEKDFAIVHSLTFTRVAIAEQDLVKAQRYLNRISETDATRPEVVLTRVAMELKNRKPLQALAAMNSFGASV